MRGRALWVLVLLLAPSVYTTSGATGQDPGAPEDLTWWGPERFSQGWNLRVPVTVTQTGGIDVQNPVVVADLDLGQLALEAGWPNSETGGRAFLKSFHLDPASVRVVEYTNFRLPRQSPDDASLVAADPDLPDPERFTVPARVETTFLDRTAQGPFDARNNPTISVSWAIDGTLRSGQARHFVVYAHIEQNGQRSPMDQDRVYKALGGLYWTSRGHEVYGTGKTLTVLATHPDTQVEVFTYEGHRPVRFDASGTTNPFTLAAGESRNLALGPVPKAFRVVADKPVVATGQQTADEEADVNSAKGYLPSQDATIRGTQFHAIVSPSLYYVYTDDPRGAKGTLNGRPFSTQGLVTPVDVDEERFRLELDRPVIVQGRPDMDRYQLADLTGTPIGNRLVGTSFGTNWCGGCQTPLQQEPGGLQFFAIDEPVSVRALSTASDGAQLVPTSSSEAALAVEPGRPQLVQQEDTWGFDPVEVLAVDPSAPDQLDPRAQAMVVGGPPTSPFSQGEARIANPLGGQWAQNFTAPTRAYVFAFYNSTRVQASWDNGTTRAQLLDRGDRMTVPGSSSQPSHITATKPVAVVPTEGIAYGPARLDSPRVQVGPLQYRGYLVDLSPAGDQEEPVVRQASFGDEVTYHLVARNLGRASDGSGLADTVELSTPPAPPGWNITIQPRAVDLGPSEAANVTVTVRTPETRDLGDRLRLKVAAASQGNPRMEAQVELITLLRERRDVGLWFEREGGPQQLLARFDPGEQRSIPVVAKNQGSARDALGLSLTNVQIGWSARLVDGDRRVSTLPLAPGQARDLSLEVQAPPSGGLILPTSFTVGATSLNDTTATDKLLFDGLVLAKSKLALESPTPRLDVRPGERAVFDLHLANEGNATADVQLNASTSLPPGWDEPRFRFKGQDLAGVDNRITSLPPTGNEPLALTVELDVPANATGRLHRKVLVTATPSGGTSDRPVTLPLDLAVLPVVDLRAQTPPGRTLVPPGGTTTFNLTLANGGNVNASIGLEPSNVPPEWSLTHPARIQVPQGAERRVSVGVAAPAGTQPENRTLELRLLLPNGTAETVSVPVQVPTQSVLRLRSLGPIPTLVAGVQTNLTLEATSRGNAPAQVAVQVDAPEGWNVTVSGPSAPLPPLHTTRFRLGLQPPAEAGQDPVVLQLRPNATGDALPVHGSSLELNVTAGRGELALGEVRAEPAQTGGASAVVRGLVLNEGPVALENVTVALVQGDQRLSQVTIAKLPAESPRSFALEVPEDAPPLAQLSVKVDPADRVPEGNEDDNVRSLATIDGVRDTPMPPAVWLVMLAALLCRRRRRR